MEFSPQDVIQEIGRQASNFGVDPKIASSLFMAENSKDGINATAKGGAVSGPGAQGVMQVMPGTARGLQKAGLLPPDWKHNPDDLSSQVSAGLAAIKDVMTRAKDPTDVFDIAAGFNGSPSVQRAYQSGQLDKLPKETQGYFGKVATAANNFGLKVSNPMATGTAATGPGTGDYGPTVDYGNPASPTDADVTAGNAGGITSARTSIKKNIFAPGAIDDFISATSGAINSVKDAAQQIIAGGQTRQSLVDNLTSAIQQHASDEGSVAAAEAAQAAAVAARRAGILTALHINPDFADNLGLSTAKVISDTGDQLAAMKPEIDERMGVGMFDNPFQWLVNQTILPGLVSKYNSLATTQNAAITQYKDVSSIAKTQQEVSSGMDADLALKKGVALAASAASKATVDLTQKQIEANAATSRDAMNVAQLAEANANLTGSVLQKTKEVETDSKLTSDKQTTEAAQQELLNKVNTIQKTIGGQQYKTVKQFQMEPKDKQEQILAAARSGKYGDDFGSSMALISGHGDWNDIAKNGGAAISIWTKKAQQAADDASASELQAMKTANPSEYNKVTLNAKDKAEFQKSMLNRIGNGYEYQMSHDMATASDGNPYKIQYMQAARAPGMDNNPVALFLRQYGPGGTDPRYSNVSEPVLLDRFGYSVSTGRMPMPDAVKAITDFYRTATQQQLEINKQALFGIKVPDTTYSVNLRNTTGLQKPVDLGNPTQVEMALTRMVARRALDATSGMTFDNTPFNAFQH